VNTKEQPGTVVKIESDYFVVQTGFEEAIRINELQPAGKKKMSAVDYLRGVGSKLRIGDTFE
jgi:methionyl-tRNA formyltransferase